MPDPEDANRFEQLKHALKTVGFSKRHVAQTCQLVAAILHLGNLDFITDRKRNEDAAVVRNTEVLDLVAEFLGVIPGQLESTLSYRTKLVKKELCTVFLDPEGASDNRDDLARSLYSLLFAWLNEHINQRLCREDFTTFIGLFDLPGPQNLSGSRSNSLDQLMVNFANERLLHFVQNKMFESHVDEYTTEGISKYVPSVQYYDNRETIKLFCNRPGGLIHIMDDQARRAPKKNAHTMVEAMTKRWANNNNYESPGVDRSGFPTFKINHFNGSVTYSSEDFLERDTDALNPDFVSLLRGSQDYDEDKPMPTHPAAGEATGSNNPFVRGLFSAKAIATQAHPRHEETIVAAQQSVKPMRQPSTRRKQSVRKRQLTGGGIEPTIKEDEETPEEAPSGIHCVAGEFSQALETLFQTLDDTQSWFIFCINPNDSQLSNQLEGRMVRAQVRSFGLPEMTKRSGVVFTVSMEPGEFVDRYKDQLTLLGVGEGTEKEKVEQARTALGLSETDIVQGAFKVLASIYWCTMEC